MAETAENVRGTATDHQSDLITTIRPSLFATAQSPRLKGALGYAPSVLRHVNATDQDTVVQSLLGNGTATLYPELLFFDGNVSADQAARSGLNTANNTAEIPNSDRTQQIAYSASPYTRFHIADLFQSELRYRRSQTHFSGNTGSLVSPLTGQALPAISDMTEQRVNASIETLPDVSKLDAQVVAAYDDTTSPSRILDSRTTTAGLNLRYPVTREIHALGRVGWERLTYTESFLNTTGPTWAVGALYYGNQQRTAEFTYGRREGENTFAGIGRYALTPATSVSGSYSKARSTTQQQSLQSLLIAIPTGAGTAIDATTGLPLSIANGVLNSNVPLRNDIVISENAEAGITTALGRNEISLVATRVHQVSLLHLSPNETSNSAFLTWAHQLRESLGSNVVLGYTTISPRHSQFETLSAGLSYALSDTLQTGVLYTLIHSGGAASSSVVQNLLTLSITKSF